jgi:hypothetical protein
MRKPFRDSSLDFPNERAELLAIHKLDIARLSECPRLLAKDAGGHHVPSAGALGRHYAVEFPHDLDADPLGPPMLALHEYSL